MADVVFKYEDIIWGERIGGGSFGSVFKGEFQCRWPSQCSSKAYSSLGQYLGIDIAVKEIHPSTQYDVSVSHHRARGYVC